MVFGPAAPQLISVPRRSVKHDIVVKVLLIDFLDRLGTTPRENQQPPAERVV